MVSRRACKLSSHLKNWPGFWLGWATLVVRVAAAKHLLNVTLISHVDCQIVEGYPWEDRVGV